MRSQATNALKAGSVNLTTSETKQVTVRGRKMADRFIYDVFLSHNSKDKPRVRKLAEELRAAGLRVWFDESPRQCPA